MKNIVFCDVAPCGSGLNRRFKGIYGFHLQDRGVTRDHTKASDCRLVVTHPP
jgi:hypothetical protein